MSKASGVAHVAAEELYQVFYVGLAKLFEAPLEERLTKDQILAGYLNLVYYGDQAIEIVSGSGRRVTDAAGRPVPAGGFWIAQNGGLSPPGPGICGPDHG